MVEVSCVCSAEGQALRLKRLCEAKKGGGLTDTGFVVSSSKAGKASKSVKCIMAWKSAEEAPGPPP